MCVGPQMPTQRLAGGCARSLRQKIDLTPDDADSPSFDPCSWHTSFAKFTRMGGRIHKNPGALKDQFPELMSRGSVPEFPEMPEFLGNSGNSGFPQSPQFEECVAQQGGEAPQRSQIGAPDRLGRGFAPAHPDRARPKMSVFGVVIRMGRRPHPPPSAQRGPWGGPWGP